MKTKILWAISGSFCNLKKIVEEIKICSSVYDITCILSDNVYNLDTRFYKHNELIKDIENITKHKVMHKITEVEMLGPSKKYAMLVIAPMSATQLAKLNYGIYDNAITLAAKSMLRNSYNILIGVSSNDILSISGVNFMSLIRFKNIYTLPIYQDDPINKPNSVVSDFNKLLIAIGETLASKQIQPVLGICSYE
ncbi:MAG: dipicolinate synthase subunit B [Erysipelotrichaceae bacterium]